MYYPTKVGKLSDAQMRNLMNGRGVRVRSGAEHILNLTKEQIKKLERAAKKGAGVTLVLDPYQCEHMKGGAIGGKKLGRKIVSGLKVAGKHAIEQGLPIALGLASMAAGDPTGMSGAAAGNIAAEYASDAYEKKVMKGNGLFKKLHKAGINVKRGAVIKELKGAASAAADIGSKMAGTAIATYTGNPILGQQFAEMSNSVAQNAISSGNFKKSLGDAGKMTTQQAKQQALRFAVEAVDDQIDKKLSGNEKRLAQNLLANKYGSARDLVYDMSEMYTGTGMKLKRKPGRPRKSTGGALYPAGYGK